MHLLSLSDFYPTTGGAYYGNHSEAQIERVTWPFRYCWPAFNMLRARLVRAAVVWADDNTENKFRNEEKDCAF